MTSALVDRPSRNLTPTERRDRERLMPALQAWTEYLTTTATAPTGSFERAIERRSAVILCGDKGKALKPPVAVYPQWAFEWALGHGHRGNPGTGSPLSFSAMVDALDFMGGVPAVTFRPLLDSQHQRRRRDGFFHLTGEMHSRLWQSCYVPVLTPRSGPRRSRPERPPALRTPRAIHRGEADPTLSIVRDWVRTTEVTALLATAVAHHRPLATRPPGRPATTSHRGVQVAPGHVLGRVDALVAHAVEHSGRTGWRVLSSTELAASLARHAEATPDVLAPVTRFSVVDAPRQKHVRGWWRFALAPLGLGALDPTDLLAEVRHWEYTRSRPVDPAPRQPSRTIGGVVLPDDVDLEWLEDMDYRGMWRISDEDYARWKEGL